jgi:hypothetical protein
VPEERDPQQLRRIQLERERLEAARAETAADEQELAQHDRRAEKARYLRQKLEEQAEADQTAD